MKKLLAVMIVASLALGVSTCGEQKVQEADSKPAAESTQPAGNSAK